MEYPEFHQYIKNMLAELHEDMIYRCRKFYQSGGLDTAQMNAAMVAFAAAIQDKADNFMDLAKRAGLTKEVKNLRHF